MACMASISGVYFSSSNPTINRSSHLTRSVTSGPLVLFQVDADRHFDARRGKPVNPDTRPWTTEEETLLGIKPDSALPTFWAAHWAP